MFDSLVPAAVHQALIASSGRKAQVVNMETGRLREYTQLLNGSVAFLCKS